MRPVIAAQCINCGHVDPRADGVDNCPRCGSFELHRWEAEELADDEVIRVDLTDSGREVLLAEVQE